MADETLTVYGIANCDSCRKTRKFLSERGIEHAFHDLRKDGLEPRVLERWANELGWEALLNRRSLTWRQVPPAKREAMDHDRALALMLDEPTLVKRPVIESGACTTVGFSEARLAKLADGRD